MMFTLFNAIVAIIAQLLSPVTGGVADTATPIDTGGASEVVREVEVGAPLETTVPATAQPATPQQLADIRNGTWVSTARPDTTTMEFGAYYRNQPEDAEFLVEEFTPTTIPADLQWFSGGASCNHRSFGVWFEGAVMKTTSGGMSTLIGCTEEEDLRDQQALAFIEASPTVYLDSDGSIYLVRDDNVASQWRRP